MILVPQRIIPRVYQVLLQIRRLVLGVSETKLLHGDLESIERRRVNSLVIALRHVISEGNVLHQKILRNDSIDIVL